MFTQSQPFSCQLQHDNAHSSDDKLKGDKATYSHFHPNVSPELRLQPTATKERSNYEDSAHRSNFYHTAMTNSTASTIPSNFQCNSFDCYPYGKPTSDAFPSVNITSAHYEPNFGIASFHPEKNFSGYSTSDMSYRNENNKVHTFPRHLKTHRNMNSTTDCQSRFLNLDCQTQNFKVGTYLNNPKLSLPNCSRFMQMENEPNETVLGNTSQRTFNSHLPISTRSGPPDCTRSRQSFIRIEPEHSITAGKLI